MGAHPSKLREKESWTAAEIEGFWNEYDVTWEHTGRCISYFIFVSFAATPTLVQALVQTSNVARGAKVWRWVLPSHKRPPECTRGASRASREVDRSGDLTHGELGKLCDSIAGGFAAKTPLPVAYAAASS